MAMIIQKFLYSRQIIVLSITSSLILLVIGVLMRGEDIKSIGVAFLIIPWFTLVPGSFLLLIYERRTRNRIGFILMSHAVGLSLVPIVYYSLFSIGKWQFYGEIQSIVNLGLLFVLIFKKRTRLYLFGFTKCQKNTVASIGLFLLAVSLVMVVRRFTQLIVLNDVVEVKTTVEWDACSLMGVVSGIKNYGYCLTLRDGATPWSYHHFIYLFMALVSSYSGATTLSAYQVIFPVYLFLLLSITVFYLAREISGNNKAALMAGLFVLLLDDFSILNQGIRFLFNRAPQSIIYRIYTVKYLHLSPSLLISICIVLILLAELWIYQKNRNFKFAALIPFILVASVLVGLKATTWVCFMGGLGLGSLLLIREKPSLMALTAASGIGGIGVLFFLMGTSSVTHATREFGIGYPVLRNEIIQSIFTTGYLYTLHELTPKIVLLIFLFFIPWIILSYGIRVIWIIRALRELANFKRNLPFVELVVLFAVISGIVISVTAAPVHHAAHNIYYFSIFGLYITVPFVFPLIYNILFSNSKSWMKMAVIVVLGMQCSSGIAEILSPLVRGQPLAELSKGWIEAMAYIRTNSHVHSKILSNDYASLHDSTKVKRNIPSLIPTFSERAIVISQKRVHQTLEKEYDRKINLANDLWNTNSWKVAKSICDKLKINYLVINKKKGKSLSCRDSRFVSQWYENDEFEIFKVIL